MAADLDCEINVDTSAGDDLITLPQMEDAAASIIQDCVHTGHGGVVRNLGKYE